MANYEINNTPKIETFKNSFYIDNTYKRVFTAMLGIINSTIECLLTNWSVFVLKSDNSTRLRLISQSFLVGTNFTDQYNIVG